MHPYHLLINGALVAGDQTMTVLNPATGEALSECPRASAAQAQAAIAAAKHAFEGWRRTSHQERSAMLLAVADGMQAERDALATLLTQEQGKPLPEAGMEIDAAIGFLRYFAGIDLAPKLLEDTATRRVEAQRRPLGVVAAIVPWNFPVLLAWGKVGPALIAGNTVVLKPAPTTPLTTLKIGEICARILPAGVLNVITDANDLGPVLTTHPDVSKVSFTGSTETGRKVMASAAGSIKRVTLELGGNDAAIVLGDVNPEQAAASLFPLAFLNCGQVCLAIKRLYVHESIYDRVCTALGQLADAAVVGDGLTPGVQFGPVQNRQQFDKVKGLLEEAARTGTVVAGGQALGGAGYFIRPTIIRDVTDGDRIVDEEQFGPVLPVIRFSDPEDALRRANASQHGLGGSIWSNDLPLATELASRMEAGTVWINKHLDFGPTLPFGGAKQSGLGVEFGEEGVAEFTQLHVVNIAR